MTNTNRFIKSIAYSLGRFIPDKMYLKIRYWITFHKVLNLKNPQTYNEKLQWMKLYDRNPLYTKLVDKYEVKDYVASVIGSEHLIPTLGVWERFDDIDFSKLPEQFVLKCTHDSGSVLICRDKKSLKLDEAKKHFKKCLRTKEYNGGREWAYKKVKPRIIAEKYMGDESGTGLKDYKFFCFNGKVKALFIATDRGVEGTDVKFDFFDEEFNHLPVKHVHENACNQPQKPDKFDEMKLIAEKLSNGMRHVRVDLYNIEGKIYFGELTFYHHCGFVPFEPNEWDYVFGSWMPLD